MRTCSILLLFLSLAGCASAQTYTGVAWSQDAKTAQEAQALIPRAYLDGAQPTTTVCTAGVVLTNVLCAGTAAPFLCSASAAFSPGRHTLSLAVCEPDSSAESSPSAAITFTQAHAAPVNVAPKK